MNNDENIITYKEEIYCDGGTYKAGGHPGIYLIFGSKKEITCPYCSKRFVYKKNK